MKKRKLLPVGLCLSFLVLAPPADAREQEQNSGAGAAPAGWSTSARGGAVYQFDSDLDRGGSFSSARFNIQAGPGYAWNRRNSVALSLSYSYDGYSFSGGAPGGFAAAAPWEDVHSLSLGVPLRWGIGERWSSIVIPSLRSTGESGASFEETITGGLLAGFAYRFGERLTIGPGLGVVSQLEESASIFPVLVIDWQITDKLSLETGRGLAATLGPGLTLNYQANDRWSFFAGGRYEKLRFRLDDKGSAPGGIGEDSAFPLFGGATFTVSPTSSVSLVGGAELGGELKQESDKGRTLAEESYDPALFLGLTFNVRL